jgi:hypothetical protein
LFKGRHFEPEIIILCVRRYLRYALSLRNLEEIMAERNVHVAILDADMPAQGCVSQLLTGDFVFALFFRVPDWFGALHLREFLPPIKYKEEQQQSGPGIRPGRCR